MAICKRFLDESLMDHKGTDEITSPDGLLKPLTQAVIGRAMQAEMTEQLGLEKAIYKPNQRATEGRFIEKKLRSDRLSSQSGRVRRDRGEMGTREPDDLPVLGVSVA